MANKTKNHGRLISTRNQPNKTNINCLTGARKLESMVTQIFGLFINLLFVFPLCPHGVFLLLLLFRQANICNLWIWYMKIPIVQKMCTLFVVEPIHALAKGTRTLHFVAKMVFSFLFAFYYISTFISFAIFSIWSETCCCFLFICFVHLTVFWTWLQNSGNVYSNILSKHKYWKYENCCKVNVTIENEMKMVKVCGEWTNMRRPQRRWTYRVFFRINAFTKRQSIPIYFSNAERLCGIFLLYCSLFHLNFIQGQWFRDFFHRLKHVSILFEMSLNRTGFMVHRIQLKWHNLDNSSSLIVFAFVLNTYFSLCRQWVYKNHKLFDRIPTQVADAACIPVDLQFPSHCIF